MTVFDDDDRKAAAERACAEARVAQAALTRTLTEIGEWLPALPPEEADRVVADIRLMIECADFEFRRGVFAIRK